MKRIILITLVILFGITLKFTLIAQDLTKMTETERNKILLKTAKEAIQKYAPDYYKYTSGKYRITLSDIHIAPEIKKSFYVVRFTSYDQKEEYFWSGYAVGVHIRADTGVAWDISNGNWNAIRIPQEPLTRGAQAPVLEYKKVPPPPPGSFS